jgi:MerR family mercuric resistance operon transcriptional regulator
MLRPPPGTEGSRRVDGATETHMLVFIRRGRELGFGLDDIRVLLALEARRGRRYAPTYARSPRTILTISAQRSPTLGNSKSCLQRHSHNVPEAGHQICPVLEILDVRRS